MLYNLAHTGDQRSEMLRPDVLEMHIATIVAGDLPARLAVVSFLSQSAFANALRANVLEELLSRQIGDVPRDAEGSVEVAQTALTPRTKNATPTEFTCSLLYPLGVLAERGGEGVQQLIAQLEDQQVRLAARPHRMGTGHC